jgi:protein-glutamine gamma-glutamyltransferase
MVYSQALRLTSILLAAVSFIGLTLGSGLPAWLAVLTGVALIVVLVRHVAAGPIVHLTPHVPFSSTGWNLLVILGFLGFLVDMFLVSGELLPAGIHFLMILMVIKLFNLRHRRDYLHLYAISLVAMLASGSLTTDLWYLPIFLLYLVAGVWTLILFQITKGSEDTGTSPMKSPLAQPELPGRVTPQLFWLANGLALVCFGMTVAIFFTIPRLSAGFYQKGFGENIRTSGFSETVNLGAIGPIKRDPSVVMRVEVPGRAPHSSDRFYVRGLAFDQYDGKSWTNRLGYRRNLSEESLGTFILRGHRSPAGSRLGDAIQQNILLEPLDTAVLFGAPFVERISGNFPAVQSDLAGSVYLPFPSASRIEYSVVSRSNPLLPTDLGSDPPQYSESFAGHFLEIPHQSERIGRLAEDLTRSQPNLYEKAHAIQTFLIRNYRYSLEAPLAGLDHPLEEFLFIRKTGYCEHYATAMVIMLRTVGIPARLVTGFLATEWNEYGSYYVVRQQDAHAWVEVHLPHSGWVMMDPTPPSSEAVGNEHSPWRALERIIDSVKLQWNRFFVQYSAADQLAVVRELTAGGKSAGHKALDSMATILSPFTRLLGMIPDQVFRGNIRPQSVILALTVVVFFILLWLGLRRIARVRIDKKIASEEQRIVDLYKQMIKRVADRGIEKPAGTTPLEFVHVTRMRWSEANSAVASITELYCRARFGGLLLTDDELQLAKDRLRQLTSLKSPHTEGKDDERE